MIINEVVEWIEFCQTTNTNKATKYNVRNLTYFTNKNKNKNRKGGEIENGNVFCKISNKNLAYLVYEDDLTVLKRN